MSEGPDWRQAEKDAQDRLGLSSTIASGNQWHDIGDAVSNAHYAEDRFGVVVDTKSTLAKSYRVEREMLQDWWERATMSGKRFVLHIQFQEPKKLPSDWALMRFEDFEEVYHLARDPLPAKVVYRTVEQAAALEGMKILVRQIRETDLKLKYYDWLEVIEKAMPPKGETK